MTGFLNISPIFLLVAISQTVLAEMCSSGYTYIPSFSSCYKYHSENRIWTEARDTCRDEGAVLFYPETEDEMRVVQRTLGFDTGRYLNGGFSNLDNMKSYTTVDGRPISQVFHEFGSEYNIYKYDENGCGWLSFSSNKIAINKCDNPFLSFICKNPQITASIVHTATGQVNTLIGMSVVCVANATDKLERRMEQQASVEQSLLERLIDAVSRQTEAQRMQAANQTAAVELLYHQSEAQTALLRELATASSRQTELMHRELALIERQTSNLFVAMERHAANISGTLEKLESFGVENVQ